MSQTYDYLIKLLLVGSTSAGKSAILLRYCDEEFGSAFITTIGIDFKIKSIVINGKNLKLQIWDTAGQERFRTITSSYYRGAHAVALIYSTYDLSSWQGIDQHVEAIKTYNPSLPTVLVAHLYDQSDSGAQRLISTEEGKQKAMELGDVPYFEVNAARNENINEMFHRLAWEGFKPKLPEDERYLDLPPSSAKSARKI